MVAALPCPAPQPLHCPLLRPSQLAIGWAAADSAPLLALFCPLYPFAPTTFPPTQSCWSFTAPLPIIIPLFFLPAPPCGQAETRYDVMNGEAVVVQPLTINLAGPGLYQVIIRAAQRSTAQHSAAQRSTASLDSALPCARAYAAHGGSRGGECVRGGGGGAGFDLESRALLNGQGCSLVTPIPPWLGPGWMALGPRHPAQRLRAVPALPSAPDSCKPH